MNIMYKLGLVSIGVFAIMAFICIISVSSYRRTLDEKTKGKISSGSFHGGTYYAQPLLPIEKFTADEEINNLIKKHNKRISIFYMYIRFSSYCCNACYD